MSSVYARIKNTATDTGSDLDKRIFKLKVTKKPELKCVKLSSALVLHTYGSFVQQCRDAEDVAVTDIGYGAFDDALAAFQTPVALECIPRSLTLNPVEHFQPAEAGDQHQL